jgi:hypothetical protein
MSTRDEVLQQALSLPLTDQAFVADMLERKIAETQSISSDLGISWTMEIDRRVAAFGRGELASLDFDQSLHQLRQSITEHRNSRDG